MKKQSAKRVTTKRKKKK